MPFKDLAADWEKFGTTDPLWSILAEDDKRGNQWDREDFFQTGKEEIDALIGYLHTKEIPIPVGTAMDFGCGVGRLTQALSQYFDSVVGVDVAPSMIRQANAFNRHPENCSYYLNQQPNLSFFANDSFDFVFSSITLQHIDQRNIKRYLREFTRVLKPNGLLIFQLPDTSLRQDMSLLKKIKKMIKTALPMVVIRLHRKIVFKDQPVMEMSGIRRKRVENLLSAQGLELLFAVEDDKAKGDWISLQYCFRKSSN